MRARWAAAARALGVRAAREACRALAVAASSEAVQQQEEEEGGDSEDEKKREIKIEGLGQDDSEENSGDET